MRYFTNNPLERLMMQKPKAAREDSPPDAAKAPVLMGHHFSSIAGAGPINGPIQAAVFGWVPVLRYSSVPGVGICCSVSIRAILVGPFPARQRLYICLTTGAASSSIMKFSSSSMR